MKLNKTILLLMALIFTGLFCFLFFRGSLTILATKAGSIGVSIPLTPSFSIDPQIRRLRDKKQPVDVRLNDISALCMMDSARAPEVLTSILLDKSEPMELRNAIAQEFRQMKDFRAEKVLEKYKNEFVGAVSPGESAAQRFVKQAQESDRVKGLTEKTDYFRMQAQESERVEKVLQEARGFNLYESFEPLLKDKNSRVRMAGCASLGDSRDTRAIAPLAKALRDEDQGVRRAAAAALIRIADVSVFGHLIDVLKDPQSPASDDAYFSLLELTGENIEKDFKKWKAWLDRNETFLKYYFTSKPRLHR